ncbi:centromere-binding protein 1 [Trichomonascus vanleenenianus]|uniref:Cbf1p n=1 Tax=Trichomonascus vanleenenianus TaxID=2268995 RepID=UPI003ECA74AD
MQVNESSALSDIKQEKAHGKRKLDDQGVEGKRQKLDRDLKEGRLPDEEEDEGSESDHSNTDPMVKSQSQAAAAAAAAAAAEESQHDKAAEAAAAAVAAPGTWTIPATNHSNLQEALHKMRGGHHPYDDLSVNSPTVAAALAAARAAPQTTPSVGHLASEQQAQGQGGAEVHPGMVQQGKRPAVGTEEWHRIRRDSHKEVERRRRVSINEGINKIAEIVPDCDKQKSHILRRAYDYIVKLKENEQANMQKWTLEKLLTEQAIAELSAQNKTLRNELNQAWREAEQWKNACTSRGITLDDTSASREKHSDENNYYENSNSSNSKRDDE